MNTSQGMLNHEAYNSPAWKIEFEIKTMERIKRLVVAKG